MTRDTRNILLLALALLSFIPLCYLIGTRLNPPPPKPKQEAAAPAPKPVFPYQTPSGFPCTREAWTRQFTTGEYKPGEQPCRPGGVEPMSEEKLAKIREEDRKQRERDEWIARCVVLHNTPRSLMSPKDEDDWSTCKTAAALAGTHF